MQVTVLDTTLRDGLLGLGREVCLEDRVEAAGMIRNLGVGVIEAGYPARYPDDRDALEVISEKVHGALICALAGSISEEIKAAAGALAEAPEKRIHVYTDVTGEKTGGVLDAVKDAVALAGSFAPEVQWTPFGATRSDPGLLMEAVEAALDAGAAVVGVPDTFGDAATEKFRALVKSVVQRVSSRAVVSVHCHDDGGLAVANTLAGVEEGAGQVEATVSGMGPGGGNAPLERLVPELAQRGLLESINPELFKKITAYIRRHLGIDV